MINCKLHVRMYMYNDRQYMYIVHVMYNVMQCMYGITLHPIKIDRNNLRRYMYKLYILYTRRLTCTMNVLSKFCTRGF